MDPSKLPRAYKMFRNSPRSSNPCKSMINSKRSISRRKRKRRAKRRVVTIKKPNKKSSRVNSFFDKKNIEDASFDELLREYENIQTQLKQLEMQDKCDNSNEDSSLSKDGVVDDNDLLELRRIALESKKNKLNEEQVKNENDQSNDNEQHDDNDDELDADLLRRQLLTSLLEGKTNKRSKSIDRDERPSTSFDSNVNKTNEKNSLSDSNRASPIDPINKVSRESNYKSGQFIIHFGDDSSSEEESEFEGSKEVINNNSAILNSIDSFLRESKINSSKITETPTSRIVKPLTSTPNLSTILIQPQNRSALKKLSLAQQKEYQKLVELIERKEEMRGSKHLLKRKEILWKEKKANLTEKFAKMKALKVEVIRKRNEMRKAQQNAKKLHDAYLAATKLVKTSAVGLNTLNTHLKSLEETTTKESHELNQIETQCIKLGLKIHGNIYKLPNETTLTRSNDSENKLLNKDGEPMNKKELAEERESLQQRAIEVSERLNILKNNTIHVRELNSSKIVTEKAKQSLSQFIKQLTNSSLYFSSTSLESFINMMFLDRFVRRFDFKCKILQENEKMKNLEKSTEKLNPIENDNNTNESVLSHLRAYRLTEHQNEKITSFHWANKVNPFEYMCLYDLNGTCNDENCSWQHCKSCTLEPSEILADLLLYKPKIAGFSEEIFWDEDKENLKQKLQLYANKLVNKYPNCSIEEICQKIVELIREQVQNESICSMTSFVPKAFQKSLSNVPLDNLQHRFRFKDPLFTLNGAKIHQLRITADPEINIIKRFFAPEGVPLNAQLEKSLASDPSNIQLWIKLAYYYITKEYGKKKDAIDKALNVLSRALEFNPNQPELYEHYLFIYSNRVCRKDQIDKYSLINIGKKIVKYCSHFKVWKSYLSLCLSFPDKENVSLDFLNYLLDKQQSEIQDVHQYSHELIEVFLYRIQLYLQVGNVNKAILLYKNVLNQLEDDIIENENCLPSEISKQKLLPEKLISNDYVFLWLLYLHLIFFNCLPSHCFGSFRQSYSQLISKNTFLFPWLQLNESLNEQFIFNHFKTAFNACQNCLTFPLFANLVKYEITRNRFISESKFALYESLMNFHYAEKCLEFWTFKAQISSLNEDQRSTIEVLIDCPFYSKNDINILYNLASYYYEFKSFPQANLMLHKVVSQYFESELEYDTNLSLAYKTLLMDDVYLGHTLVEGRITKQSRCIKLWLCYILLLQIYGTTKDEIENTFQSALAACSDDQNSKSDLQLLWWQYIKFLVETTENQKQFDKLTSMIRYCCLTVQDPSFQYQLVRFYCKLLSNTNEKLKSMIQFAKLLPKNNLIVLGALSLAFKIKRVDLGWDLVNFIVSEKKLKPVGSSFWKVSIALSLEKNDFLSTHKFFSMALSVLPYNISLWKLLFDYETSISHVNHIHQAKQAYENQLQLPQLSQN